MDLAALNKAANNIDGWVAVQQEIVRRFPASQEATEAARFLFVYYSSAEVRKYRVQQVQSRAAKRGQFATSGVNSGALAGQFPGTPVDGQFPATSLPFDSTLAAPIPNLVVPATGIVTTPKIQQATGVTFGPGASDHGQTLQTAWDRQASTALQILTDNLQLQIPSSVILRQAANLRRNDRSGEQSRLLAEVDSRNDAWKTFAQAETQAIHGASATALPVFNLRKALDRPWLDATLADECWIQADEITLVNSGIAGAADDPSSLVMMSWDDQFLYVAARFEHQRGGPSPQPVAIDRSYDSDHGARDCFELQLDIDRDYSTAFVFRVDQTGATSERCDLLIDWNPQWFVAVESDQATWRLELAIPLESLDLNQTKAGDLWTIHLRRTLPGFFEHTIRQSFTNMQTDNSDDLLDQATVAASDTALIRFIRTNRKKR